MLILERRQIKVESRNSRTREVVETILLWRVVVVDDAGNKRVLEFVSQPSDLDILERLPKVTGLGPGLAVEKWFGLREVKQEAILRGETALAAQAAQLEELAWQDVKTEFMKIL